MCGRYTLVANATNLAEQFSISEILDFDIDIARYNIAPGQQVPIIHMENNSIRVTNMTWGLVPVWNKSDHKVRPINARLETLSTKPMFKRLLSHKRCLVPASAFYEWQDNSFPKQPYYFSIPHQQVFAFAGLWDKTMTADGLPLYSFTIITTPASQEAASIHHRMPFILDPQFYQEWLKDPYVTLHDKQFQYPLHNHPVSTDLNSAKHDDPSLINPI